MGLKSLVHQSPKLGVAKHRSIDHRGSFHFSAAMIVMLSTAANACAFHRYIPNAKMQYEYPGSYQASDAQACFADANLLLHEEAELYNDPYADPYEDDPDYVPGRCPAEKAEAQSQQAAASLASGTAEAREHGGKAGGSDATKAKANKESKEEGPGHGLPEQSVGTDVKR